MCSGVFPLSSSVARRNLFCDSARSPWRKVEEKLRRGEEVGLARGKGGSVPDAVLPVGRQAPREWRRSSNWPSASIPTAAAAGHPIRRPNRTSPLVTVEAPVLVSAGSYWLQTRLQEPPLRVPPRTIHSSIELLAVQRLAITLYLVHVLPAAHNKAILMFDAPRSVAVVAVDGDTSFSEASRKLPADYLVSRVDKSLLWNDSGRKWS